MSDQQPTLPSISAQASPPPPPTTATTKIDESNNNKDHPAPSQPTSPLAKRFKMDEGGDSSYVKMDGGGNSGAHSLPSVASILNHDPVPSMQSMPPPASLSHTLLDQHARGPPPPPSLLSDPDVAIAPLQIKKLNPKARAPTRGSAFAAGYDLYSAEDATIPARGQTMLSTGIAIAVPKGTYGRVAPRSGLAVKHSIATGAGVIDYDYRGEVKLLLFNHSDADFQIKEGDRMAQLVLERIVTPEVIEVQELPDTVRGAGGFGSTGGFGTGAVATATTAAQGTPT